MALRAPTTLEPRRPTCVRPVPVVPRRGPRAAVSRALSRCIQRERVLLALILFEHLTPAEAASVLDIPVARIERAYAALLADLRDVLARRVARPPSAGSRSSTDTRPAAGARRARAPRPQTPAARLRRAS